MTAWQNDSLCNHFPGLPWIAEPEDRSRRDEAEMRIVCRACPLLAPCEAYAEGHEVTAGFWAGRGRETFPEDSAGEVA